MTSGGFDPRLLRPFSREDEVHERSLSILRK